MGKSFLPAFSAGKKIGMTAGNSSQKIKPQITIKFEAFISLKIE